MTVTPRGIGISAGVKGARISANTAGRVTRTVGIPGTGISHVSTTSSGRHASGQTGRPSPTPNQIPPQAPQTPGMFAPRWEKDLHRCLLANDFSPLEAIARSDGQARQTCIFADSFMHSYPAGDVGRARYLAEVLWGEGYDPSRDPFLAKYFPGAMIQLGIADGITVTMPCDRDMLGLALAELRQLQNDLPGAIDIVEQLTPTTLTAVSLAELYCLEARWADVVDLTNGVTNDDDFATFLLIQRGIAFREQRYFEAAREAFKVAYAVRSRAAVLRRMALIERGETYLAEGKRALARKDFEKVLSEDAQYSGLQEHLASLDA